MTAQDWGALVAGVVTGISALVGVVKWLVKHYLAELKPNGGGSVKDQVNRLEARVDQIYTLLLERKDK